MRSNIYSGILARSVWNRILVLSLASILFTSCKSGSVRESATDPSQFQTISADDKRFAYEGRIDFNDPRAPVIIWQASRIRLDFEGDSLTLLFDEPKDQCYFNATIDGVTTLVELREGVPFRGTNLSGL